MSLCKLLVAVVFLWSSAVSHAAVEITIGEGNEISLPAGYAAPQWTAEWFMEDGSAVPEALLLHNSGTSVSVLSNIGYVYAVLTEAETQRTVRTTGVNADRLRVRVATLRLDGTGSDNKMVFVNNGVTSVQEFSVEIAGIVADAPVGIATVVLPQLVGEYDINVNHPERIGAMMLDGAGISSIDVDKSCRNLNELSLKDNSLGFGGVPEWLPEGCEVNYGMQSPVHISVLADGMTVDLSAVAMGDVTVSWYDDGGDPIDGSCYERSGQSYVFTGYTGKAWCSMTSASLGLTLKSTTISVGADMCPVFSGSWARAAGNAAFAVGVSERTAVAIDDGAVQMLEADADNWIRLPGKSGSMTLYASSVESVERMDLHGIGLYDLCINDAARLKSLVLDGNSFSPGSLPAGIPGGCEVDWGQQAIVDISRLSNPGERWVDLTGFSDIEVSWSDSSTGEPLTSAQIVERPKCLFTFAADVTGVYGVLRSISHDGLKWHTTEVRFPGYNSQLGEVSSRCGVYSIEGNTIVSSGHAELRVYTLDGQLKCCVAPMGRSSLPSGIYVVSGAGVSDIVKI